MLMFSNAEHTRVENFLFKLTALKSVIKQLQSINICIADVRYPLDIVSDRYAELENRLLATAPIVQNADFVSALVQLLDNKTNALTDEKMEAVQ